MLQYYKTTKPEDIVFALTFHGVNAIEVTTNLDYDIGIYKKGIEWPNNQLHHQLKYTKGLGKFILVLCTFINFSLNISISSYFFV